MLRVQRVSAALLLAVVARAAPVHTQNDLSGERIPALSEWQCRPHGSACISRGPSQLKIWKETAAGWNPTGRL